MDKQSKTHITKKCLLEAGWKTDLQNTHTMEYAIPLKPEDLTFRGWSYGDARNMTKNGACIKVKLNYKTGIMLLNGNVWPFQITTRRYLADIMRVLNADTTADLIEIL